LTKEFPTINQRKLQSEQKLSGDRNWNCHKP